MNKATPFFRPALAQALLGLLLSILCMGHALGQRMYDGSGRPLKRVDGGERLYSASGSPMGRIDGDRVYDASGRPMGRAEGLRRMQIIIYFYFFM